MNFSNILEWTIPQGSVTQVTDSLNRVIWQKVQPVVLKNYFYVEDITGETNTLSIKKTDSNAPTVEVFYSTDQQNWTSMGNTSTTAITATIPANGKLYLKATANYWGKNVGIFNNITASGNHNVGGNIMSLLYGDNFTNQTTFPTNDEFIFNSLFKNNTTLISAANLQLPSTTLTRGCYWEMFSDCTSLTTTPVLPATTLALQCYRGMFKGCSALTTAPALPATTLTGECYYNMFGSCTALTTAPVLPATTLVDGCYNSMFSGCTGLNKVTTYADNISATYCLYQWLSNVAYTGTFNNLGFATYTRGASGIPVGWTEVKSTYFYIEDVSGSDNTLSIVKESSYTPTITVYKSTDLENWTSMGTTSTTAITATVPANGRLYLKATANGWCDDTIQGDRYNTKISASGNHNVGGNIMSLLYGDNFTNQTAFPVQNYGGVFCKLFNNDTTLVNARRLTLPATTIDVDCYYGMFKGCTSLTTSPEALPATTLAIDCYNSMFYGCTSLTSAPTISATTLANRCCNQMFYGCRTLTTAPVLYATTLTTGSYKDMFYNCRLLNSITTYANDISATDCITNWLANVAATGTFNNMGTATYITDSPSGIPQGWTEPVLDKNYFYIENTSPFDDDFEIKYSGAAPNFIVYCSTDKTNWTLMGITGLDSIETTVEPGTKLYLKATIDAWGTSTSDYNYIHSRFPYNVGGNIMSLLYGDNFDNKTLADTSSTYNFVKLFANDTELEDASDLVLPEDVTNSCYQAMFSGCTSLTTAPTLPATTLAASCYRELFSGCSSLDKIITYATSVSAFRHLQNWVSGVAATGDFYNLGGATYSSGVRGIPTGWTEHTSL